MSHQSNGQLQFDGAGTHVTNAAINYYPFFTPTAYELPGVNPSFGQADAVLPTHPFQANLSAGASFRELVCPWFYGRYKVTIIHP